MALSGGGRVLQRIRGSGEELRGPAPPPPREPKRPGIQALPVSVLRLARQHRPIRGRGDTDSNPVGTDLFRTGIRASIDTPSLRPEVAITRGTSRISLVVHAALFPGPPRDRYGTTAGHMSSGSALDTPEQPADLCFPSWGGEDSNLRPTDYESYRRRAGPSI